MCLTHPTIPATQKSSESNFLSPIEGDRVTNQGQVYRTTTGGVSGLHPAQEVLPAMVAPTVGSEYNTIQAGLTPYACWKVEDLRFEFDSSLIRPEMAEELKHLAELVEDHADAGQRPPLSIFGHADPVGQDEYNKQLSGRRAIALYGLLTRRVDLWEQLYLQPLGNGDSWREKKAVTTMLTHLQYGDSKEEVQRFQRDQGLVDDGLVGPDTRKALYRSYMDALSPMTFDPQQDFLGRGQDEKGKADYQGCGEFNPLMLFSEAEQLEYDQPDNRTQRNTENAPNRRVMVFLFRPGTKISPGRWPCPRALEGCAGCRKRFWADGERRRGERLPEQRRSYNETEDTFACRFYDGLAFRSPCERPRYAGANTLRILLHDENRQPMTNVPYRVTLLGTEEGTSPDGWLEVEIPAYSCPAQSLVEWGKPDASGLYPFRLDLALECDQGQVDEKQEAIGKLHNIGYRRELGLAECVRRFQLDEGLQVSGLDANDNVPPQTMACLRKRYASMIASRSSPTEATSP
jgi:hypothetical protein